MFPNTLSRMRTNIPPIYPVGLLALLLLAGPVGSQVPESQGDAGGILLEETFEDNRRNWRLSTNQFNAEIRNGAIRFVMGGTAKGGPSLKLEATDLYSFELEFEVKADQAMALQGMYLSDKESGGLVFGLDKGKPYLALRAGGLFGPSERNLSNQLKAAPLRASGYNRFAVHRLGNTLQCFINGTSVWYVTLGHERFGALEGLMLVSGRRGVTVTADNVRLRRRWVDLKIDRMAVRSADDQGRIRFRDSATLVFRLWNDGNYPLYRQHFELIPADRDQDWITIGRSVDSVAQILPGEPFEVSFEVAAGLVLPRDSIRFRLCTPMDGDWRRMRVAVPTVTFLDGIRPIMPAATDERQRTIRRHYGQPGGDIGECVRSLRALSAADPMARAWEGMLTSLGQGGFPRDEELGRWLLQESMPDVEAAALRGEVEAMFLLGNAWWLGLGTKEESAFAAELVAYAADQGYAPALLDYGMYLAGRQVYDAARSLLQEAYGQGLKSALTYRGIVAELGPAPDSAFALAQYRAAAAAGDPSAMVLLADRLLSGPAGSPDAGTVLRWLSDAAAAGHTGAMRRLSRHYFDGTGGKGRQVDTAVRWLSKAAEAEDREAMLTLALLRLEGSLAGGVDKRLGFEWLRKAAERGQPVAMRLLGTIYAEGELVERNLIKSRYWANRAAGSGEGSGAEQATPVHPLAAMMDHIVWVEEYQVTNEGRGATGEVRYVGTDYAASFIHTVLAAYGSSRTAPMQEQLNGVEFILSKGGLDVYAGTVASRFESQLRLEPGTTVTATASGELQAGFVHRCGPDGHADPYVQAYNYPDAAHILHAALMYRIGEGPWGLVGRGGSFRVSQAGLLALAVNDRDYSNNRGYFDVVLKVAR